MTYRVLPHVLKRDADVAVATVDGVDALIVAVTTEAADTFLSQTDLEGFEAYPATVEEIEGVCKIYNLATVGFVGFEDATMDVVSVEVVGMILEEEN
jgi:hypothetical protein